MKLSIQQLSERSGVPERSIRFYIQKGLIPRPQGETRAAFYTDGHLADLLRVKQWQEAGLPLDAIDELLKAKREAPVAPARAGSIEVRSHLILADGLELVVAPERAGLTQTQVQQLFRAVQAATAFSITGATTMTDRTHITVLLDRTGSMQDIRADVVGGFNAFVDTHKAAPGEATLTLVQFDSQNPYELLYAALPIEEVPELTLAQYVPRASTPLYDAMGRAIGALDNKLTATPAGWRPKKIIFVVVTDGQENASKQFRRDQVMNLIDAKKKDGWDFVFLSSDLGALTDAQGMGVDAAASLHFGKSAKGSHHAWASVAEKSVQRRTGAPSVAFDAADRSAQDDAK